MRISKRSSRSPASSTTSRPGRRSSRRRQPRAFQRVGLVRYNPFEETGGNQSFALALLDADGDGWVLSSLHARTGTRVYAKAIVGGRSDAACPRRRPRRSSRRRPDRLGGTAAGDGPGMAPTTTAAPDHRRPDRDDPATDSTVTAPRLGRAGSRHRSTSCRPGATSSRSWIRRSCRAARNRAGRAARRPRTPTSGGPSPTRTGRCSSSPAPGPARPRSSPAGSPG